MIAYYVCRCDQCGREDKFSHGWEVEQRVETSKGNNGYPERTETMHHFCSHSCHVEWSIKHPLKAGGS